MAGLVSEQAIDDIKRRTSLVSLIGEYVTLKKAGRSHKGLCPFHDERTPSFHVHDVEGYYYCFGCGAKGDPIHFLREHVGYDFMEAVRYLAERVGVELTMETEDPEFRVRRKERREARDRFADLNRKALRFFCEQLAGSPGEAYLKRQRGLTDETIQRFEVGFAPDSWDALVHGIGSDFQALRDAAALGLIAQRREGGHYSKYRDRVMFPVFAIGGKVAGFSGRTLSKDKETPKYVNSSESELFVKGRLLYGLVQARKAIRERERALVVEGQVDVLTLSQHGFSETVAPMGTALTEEQATLLRRFAKSVVLVYDGDSAGRAAALKAVPILLAGRVNGKIVLLPDGHDPDSYVQEQGPEALEALIANGVPLFDAALDDAMLRYDGSVPSKAEVAHAVAPLYALLDSQEERDLYRRKLAQLLHVLDNEVARWLRAGARPARTPSPTPGPDEPGPPPGWGPPVRRRPAPDLERQLLALLLRHPEYLPFWAARSGQDTLTHEGVATVLAQASEILVTRGRLEVVELLDWLGQNEMGAESRGVARILSAEDPYREQPEKAFVEIADALRDKAARREKDARRAQLRHLSLSEQLAAVQAEHARK